MDDLKFLALGNFNEVNPYEVWDFCHLGEVPTSPFQFQIFLSRAELHQRLTDEYSQFPNTTINTLDKQIMGALYKKLFYNHSIIDTNIKFLEHQYRATKDKNIFLSAVEKTINPSYYTAFWGDEIPTVANAHDIIDEIKLWRQRKIEHLSHEEFLKENRNDSNVSDISENFCLTNGQIVDLYKLLEMEKVIKPINFSDFLKCFDLNNPPIKHPVILYKKLFVYALSLIDGMNGSTALQNFGFTNYDKNKSDLKTSPIPKSKRVTENKIDSILKRPLKVISK